MTDSTTSTTPGPDRMSPELRAHLIRMGKLQPHGSDVPAPMPTPPEPPRTEPEKKPERERYLTG